MDQKKKYIIWPFVVSIILNLIFIALTIIMGCQDLHYIWALAIVLILELSFTIAQRGYVLVDMIKRHEKVTEWKMPICSIFLNILVIFIAIIMAWKHMAIALVIILVLELSFDIVQRICSIIYYTRKNKENK